MKTVDISGLSPASRRTLSAMHTSDAWLTFSEMKDGVTSMAITLMAVRHDPWVERRRVRWGGEIGQKPGKGYEYRLTARGREIRDAIDAQTV